MNSAVIVAAGRGARMGHGPDKLFLELAGRPVVAHTWGRFDAAACIGEVVLVVRDGLQEAFRSLAKRCGFQKPYRLAVGGEHRQDSVWNGLRAVAVESEIAVIQDGARPCTSHELIEDTIRAALEDGAAVAAQPVTDTIKESADGRYATGHLDRQHLWSVQTPQTFRIDVIRRAIAEARRQGTKLTDDTASCELVGQSVRLVESRLPNPKVTTTADLAVVELLLRSMVSAS